MRLTRRMVLHHLNDLSATVAFYCLWTLACYQSGVVPGQASVDLQSEGRSASTLVPREIRSSQVAYSNLNNLLHVTDKVCCGGEPQDAAAFATLAQLGVKTIVSVDGAKPNVASARKHALQYFHIPIGYDGIHKKAGLSLARLTRDLDGPFYIHCHHGHHRGPAAASIVCIASGEVDGKQALKILERAGTGKGYAGLWRDVENYRVPSANTDLPLLVEVAEVSSLAEAMVRIDRAFDNLKRYRDARWSDSENIDHSGQKFSGQGDGRSSKMLPAEEALLLKEQFRESKRNLGDGFDADFRRQLGEAESITQRLEQSVGDQFDAKDAIQQFNLLEQSCKQCHQTYRD